MVNTNPIMILDDMTDEQKKEARMHNEIESKNAETKLKRLKKENEKMKKENGQNGLETKEKPSVNEDFKVRGLYAFEKSRPIYLGKDKGGRSCRDLFNQLSMSDGTEIYVPLSRGLGHRNTRKGLRTVYRVTWVVAPFGVNHIGKDNHPEVSLATEFVQEHPISSYDSAIRYANLIAPEPGTKNKSEIWAVITRMDNSITPEWIRIWG